MISVKASGNSQPLRWRRREETGAFSSHVDAGSRQGNRADGLQADSLQDAADQKVGSDHRFRETVSLSRPGAGRRGEGEAFADALRNLPSGSAAESRQPRGLRVAGAAFVAQLIANRLNMHRIPRRRRAEREAAEASYHAADPKARPTASGSLVRREA